MALTWKILGQSNPSATTLTDLYTVPASTEATLQVVVANRGAATSFRLAVAPNGASDDNSHYTAYDVAIGANSVYTSPKITVDAADVVRVYATLATLTFSAFGAQKT